MSDVANVNKSVLISAKEELDNLVIKATKLNSDLISKQNEIKNNYPNYNTLLGKINVLEPRAVAYGYKGRLSVNFDLTNNKEFILEYKWALNTVNSMKDTTIQRTGLYFISFNVELYNRDTKNEQKCPLTLYLMENGVAKEKQRFTANFDPGSYDTVTFNVMRWLNKDVKLGFKIANNDKQRGFDVIAENSKCNIFKFGE